MELNRAKRLEIEDKQIFDRFFNDFPPKISEFSFTNLFIWRNHYNFRFMEWEDHLLIFSEEYLKKWKKPLSNMDNVIFFLPPIGPEPEQIIIELFKVQSDIEIHRVPEDLSGRVKTSKKFNALNLEIIEDRNNWDYVYEKQNLINLPGNKFRQKRRWLNKFFESHDYDFNLINEDWIEPCRQLQIEWCDRNECQSNEDLMEEQNAIDDSLKYFFDLKLNGGILCVDGKCVGYTFGEMLNKDTAVIHIEKAHAEYEGSYQAINNLFLKNCCESDATYINREQDLGISGLRRAKESYKPHHMVKKHVIYQKF